MSSPVPESRRTASAAWKKLQVGLTGTPGERWWDKKYQRYPQCKWELGNRYHDRIIVLLSERNGMERLQAFEKMLEDILLQYEQEKKLWMS